MKTTKAQSQIEGPEIAPCTTTAGQTGSAKSHSVVWALRTDASARPLPTLINQLELVDVKHAKVSDFQMRNNW